MLEATGQNDKSAAVRSFCVALYVSGKEWIFEVRRYHSADPRFEGIVSIDHEQPVEFVMIRSSIGKWILRGDILPGEMFDHAQEIGNALAEQNST